MGKKKQKHHFHCFGISDIGFGRPNNEDVWLAFPESGFFAIADGMGGHRAGEVAAQMATASLMESMSQVKTEDPLELVIELRSAIEKSNMQIIEKGKEAEECWGMGTTLCCLIWKEALLVYAHVGDSRIYRYRDEKLECLTEDHSLFAKWLSMGKIAKECQTPYPYKNVITRAIGTHKKANPEIVITTPDSRDLYLLCTDGISDVLSLEEIEETIKKSLTLEKISKSLIEQAKIKGSSDNMTALIVQKDQKSAKNLFRQQRNDTSRSEGVESHAHGA